MLARQDIQRLHAQRVARPQRDDEDALCLGEQIVVREACQGTDARIAGHPGQPGRNLGRTGPVGNAELPAVIELRAERRERRRHRRDSGPGIERQQQAEHRMGGQLFHARLDQAPIGDAKLIIEPDPGGVVALRPVRSRISTPIRIIVLRTPLVRRNVAMPRARRASMRGTPDMAVVHGRCGHDATRHGPRLAARRCVHDRRDRGPKDIRITILRQPGERAVADRLPEIAFPQQAGAGAGEGLRRLAHQQFLPVGPVELCRQQRRRHHRDPVGRGFVHLVRNAAGVAGGRDQQPRAGVERRQLLHPAENAHPRASKTAHARRPCPSGHQQLPVIADQAVQQRHDLVHEPQQAVGVGRGIVVQGADEQNVPPCLGRGRRRVRHQRMPQDVHRSAAGGR